VVISDPQFRLGVAIGAVVLVAGVTSVRFCGSVHLPEKPTTLAPMRGSTTELLASSAQTQNVYRELLNKDAVAAGVRTPSIDDMSHKFAYRSDDVRHVLDVGQPPLELAGLKLRAVHAGDSLALEIVNPTQVDLGYHIVTESLPNTGCANARPVPLDVLVVSSEPLMRTECVWHDGSALVVKKVETVELPPLGVYLIRQTPPPLLAIEPMVARGSKTGPGNKECATIQSQTLKTQLDRGDIGWRDLIDFYARHRCQTYQFPLDYRAFTQDGQRSLPATGSGN
jgi:hypothetical protein